MKTFTIRISQEDATTLDEALECYLVDREVAGKTDGFDEEVKEASKRFFDQVKEQL